MSITIKVNDKPNLSKCEMSCDNALHEKLNKFELTSLMNHHATNLFIGKPKSGKSTTILAIFAMLMVFFGAFLCQ